MVSSLPQQIQGSKLIRHSHVRTHRREKAHGESSSTCQSDDEDISGGGFLSDSESTDSDTDSTPDGHSGFPGHTGKRMLTKDSARGRSLAKNLTSSRSSSQFSEERGPARNWASAKNAGAIVKSSGNTFRRRGQEVADLGGRTSEQGKDYLIGNLTKQCT